MGIVRDSTVTAPAQLATQLHIYAIGESKTMHNSVENQKLNFAQIIEENLSNLKFFQMLVDIPLSIIIMVLLLLLIKTYYGISIRRDFHNCFNRCRNIFSYFSNQPVI